MQEKELLQRLQCPTTREPLESLDEKALEKVNTAIKAGGLTTRAGRTIEKVVEGALITRCGSTLYLMSPFPKLLPEDAISPADAGL